MTKSIIRIALIVLTILLVPLIAMQFTDEVDWSFSDFVAIGVLLFGAGIGIEVTLKKLVNPTQRVIVCATIVAVLLAVWAELAVGIFGSPFAGS